MTFCWFTSYIGYPNFIRESGRGHELAETFKQLVHAADDGLTYSEAKDLFPNLKASQVETKKAALQEYGLLYVVPRSDTITVTPLGRQVVEICNTSQSVELNKRTILLGLCRGLSRYQFNNPLPVGGNKHRDRAAISNVLPYLAFYYLIFKLDGMISVSEIFGKLFGVQDMNNLVVVESEIRQRRIEGEHFQRLPQLPPVLTTANNLKIYFMSHVSLDGELIKDKTINFYGFDEAGYELTQLGYEIIESILDEEWPGWRIGQNPPTAINYQDINEYFVLKVGQSCDEPLLNRDNERSVNKISIQSEGTIFAEELDNLKELPRRQFEEGRKKLVAHTRIERQRNQGLIKEKKQYVKNLEGHLSCTVCQFDFQPIYGDRGQDYIEAHHIVPISELADTVTVTIDDLALVCSNCHRMLHRRPWITVEQLREIVQRERSLRDTIL